MIAYGLLNLTNLIMSNAEQPNGPQTPLDEPQSIQVNYGDLVDPIEEWKCDKNSNRRVLIREYTWMVKGAANRVLREVLYVIDGEGKVFIKPEVFRKTGPEDVRLNLKTTTQPDDKKFRADVLAEVQRVIDQGPQNPENVGDKQRRAYNMGLDGAIINALKELPPAIKDPKMFKLPDDFFREGDDEDFKENVLKGVHKALELAKKDQPTKLENAMFQINEQIIGEPKIKELRDMLGEDVFDLTELFQWTVDLCEGEIPTRVTEEYMFYMFNEALKLVDQIYEEVTNPARAAEIELGFKEALYSVPGDTMDILDAEKHEARQKSVKETIKAIADRKAFVQQFEDSEEEEMTPDDQDKLKEMEVQIQVAVEFVEEVRNELIANGTYVMRDLKGKGTSEEFVDLHGTEFVKELYKQMGIHIGFQGLQSRKSTELEPVAKNHNDLNNIFSYLLGWVKSGWFREGGVPDPDPNRKHLADSTRERRTRDYIAPSLILAFDDEFGRGLKNKGKVDFLKTIQSVLGKDYLTALGVIKAMELAGRTATLDGKGHNGRARAEALCDKEILIALGTDPNNYDYCTLKYRANDDFDNRKLEYRLESPGSKGDPNVGIALGRVIPLKTRSEKPLGMDK